MPFKLTTKISFFEKAQWQKERPSICWFTLQIVTVLQAWSGWEEAGTPCVFPTCVTWAQSTWVNLLCLPSDFQGAALNRNIQDFSQYRDVGFGYHIIPAGRYAYLLVRFFFFHELFELLLYMITLLMLGVLSEHKGAFNSGRAQFCRCVWVHTYAGIFERFKLGAH